MAPCFVDGIEIDGVYLGLPFLNGMITLWLFNIAMENGPFIDGLPIKNGDFPWRTVSHN